MKYIKKSVRKKSTKSFVLKRFEKMLADVNARLEAFDTDAIKTGNQNVKRSQAYILLLNIKRILMQLISLRKQRANNPAAKKIRKMQMKRLMMQLKINIRLLNIELQKQNETRQLDTHTKPKAQQQVNVAEYVVTMQRGYSR